MRKIKDELFLSIQDDLERIETALKQNLDPHLDLVSQVAGHLLFSGGKRLRPLLMVLCARICGYSMGDEVVFSTALEYLHAATLLHDDIVDGADLRRGKPVANSIWGNPITVLVGDFLFSRASSMATRTGKMRIIEIMAEIVEEMSQGEINQLIRKGDITISEDEYMEVIRRKTAVLFQGACKAGAILADASREKEEALSAFGLNTGIAFQLIDDLIDYTSDTSTLGKTAGADLREGKLTLPVIHVLKTGEGRYKKRIQQIIQKKGVSSRNFQTLKQLLRENGGISYAHNQATLYIQEAKNSLSVFPSSRHKETLMDIADHSLVRKA